MNQLSRTIELTDRMHLVVGTNRPYAFLPCCNSLWIDDEVRALVDTAAGEALRSLAAGGVASLDLIVHTHVHPDHVNYDFLFPAARVWTPAAAGEALTSVEAFLRWTGVDALGAELARYVAGEVWFRPRTVERRYRDGELLDFGRTRLRALAAPGHSPDHTILVHEESGTVFATDIDLTPFGPWYGNPGSDIDATLRSIDALIALRPRRLVTAHHPRVVADDVEARLRRYAAIIDKRDRRLLSLLAQPQTFADLFARHPLYATHPHPREVNELWERNMLQKHLDRLVAQGRVRVDGGVYRLA